MKYYYISHLGGGLFSTTRKLSYNDLYCDECGDSDEYLGKFKTDEEAEKAYEYYLKVTYGDDDSDI